jgi:hypothetical protein
MRLMLQMSFPMRKGNGNSRGGMTTWECEVHSAAVTKAKLTGGRALT